MHLSASADPRIGKVWKKKLISNHVRFDELWLVGWVVFSLAFLYLVADSWMQIVVII